MNMHRHSILHYEEGRHCSPVGHPFSQPDHCINDLKIKILKGMFKCTQERKTFELRMIRLFDTKTKGLNADMGFLTTNQNCL
ncbi:hypothetical protein FKM82_017355 [Ascaphus truei]